jgi:hypothetical protein
MNDLRSNNVRMVPVFVWNWTQFLAMTGETAPQNDRYYFLIPDEEFESIGGKFIVQLLWYGYSRTLFTHDFVEELLLKGGFGRVSRCPYKKTSSAHPDIVELDNREEESLFVEAIK